MKRMWTLMVFLVFVSLLGASPAVSYAAVSCSDPASCTEALKALQAKFAQSQKKINTTKKTADSYQAAIQDLGAKIQTTAKKIQETQNGIVNLNKEIKSAEKTIADDNEHLKVLQSQVHQEIVAWYELSQRSGVEIILSASSFSDAMAEMDNIKTVQTAVQKKMRDIEETKAELERKKAELENKKDDLGVLHDDLTGSQQNLTAQKQQTNTLLNATEAQIDAYAKEQSEIKKQIAETQKRLSDLINEAHWGNDIVSAPAQSWTYNQLNYSSTLGSSPYTIHDYGCFITSLAMVATRNGYKVNPAQIANHAGWFDRRGYAFVETIANNIGLTIKQRGAVNWATVDDELNAGHPVIVSIYIPQVGAINTDGSSHFIVLQGKTGNTYQMQDPLGANRSYALKYVRSMVILR